MTTSVAPKTSPASVAPIKPTNPTKAAAGNLNGRTVTPYSFYVLVAGAAVGLIVAVAGFILNQRSVIYLSLVLLGTNCLAAYQIKGIALQKTIEEDLTALNTTSVVLDTDDKQLQKENNNLNETVKNYEKTFTDKEKILGDQIKEISDLTKKLADTEANLSKLQALVEPMKKTITDFENASAKFTQGTEKEKQSLQTLTDDAQKMNAEDNILVQKEKDLKSDTNQLNQFVNQATGITQALNAAVENLKNVGDLKPIENALTQSVESLTTQSNENESDLAQKMKLKADVKADLDELAKLFKTTRTP